MSISEQGVNAIHQARGHQVLRERGADWAQAVQL